MVAVFGLLGRGDALLAHAQTATTTATDTVPLVDQSDFIKELQALIAQLRADNARLLQSRDISNADTEHAGDQQGTNVVIDGEKPHSEIEKEIDSEVENESPDSEARDTENQIQGEEGGDREQRRATTTEQRSGETRTQENGGDNADQTDGESN